MTDPSFLAKAQAGKELPTTAGGASGFFSAPAETLDPSLFDGEHLRPNVRDYISEQLVHALQRMYGVLDPAWLHIWLAGSGITYQWASSRGNGDLDVLFSIDVTPFAEANDFRGISEGDLAAGINDVLKQTLWKSNSQVQFGNEIFEVTYYFNAGTGRDIRSLHPYAAYSITDDTWVVPPPQLPADPRSLYPDSWYEAVAQDSDAAKRLTAAYGVHLGELTSSHPDSPSYHTAGSRINAVVAAARSLFDDIHLGRREAFGPQGHGYGDFTNYRWQSAKESGAVQALSAIASTGDEARHAEETERYGAPIDSAEVVLRRAMNQYRSRS